MRLYRLEAKTRDPKATHLLPHYENWVDCGNVDNDNYNDIHKVMIKCNHVMYYFRIKKVIND